MDILNRLPISSWPWPKIVLFVPMFPALPYADDVFYHFMSIAAQGIPFMRPKHARTDYARNQATRALLETDFTHILMLDADHAHPHDIVQRLARWVVADPNVWIVGGLNFKRVEPYDPCAFVKYGNSNGNSQRYALLHDWEPGLVEVDIIGTGCILIDRRVFEALEVPYFYYIYDGAKDNNYPAEDTAFSLKCQAAGIKMFVDTTTTSPHLASNYITEQTFRSYWQAHPDRAAREVIDNGR